MRLLVLATTTARAARFGRVLWWVSKLEFITIFLSINFVLRFLRFLSRA